jgi:putative ABC transport system permease protein
MGLSLRQLIGILASEQLLTSGAALGVGMITGVAASKLFVPFFKLSFQQAQTPLPFQVIINAGDQLMLAGILIFMVAAALLVLGWMQSRSRVHQAVKLGED